MNNVRIPGYRRRWLNLDCITFFIFIQNKNQIYFKTFLMYRKWRETTERES